MNNNLRDGKTLKSFLAEKNKSIRKKQITELDTYIHSRKGKDKNVIRFVKYWGLSSKKFIDKFDLDAIIFLFGFLRSVEKKYKMDVHLTLVFTDTHAILNGYNPEIYNSYIKDIRHAMNCFNYSHVLMSEVLMPYIKQHNLNDLNGLISFIINESKQRQIPEYLSGRISFNRLTDSASKYSERYLNKNEFDDFGFDSSEQSAYAYILLNQTEKTYIEKVFFQSVFLTYTSDEEKEFIIPELPNLQIYSYRSGMRGRPWFSTLNKQL